MPSSIINSDDGTVSGVPGLKTSGGDDGVLKIQNNGSDSVTISAGSVSVAGDLTVSGTITGQGLTGSAVRVYNSPATWTKPSGLQYIKVTVIGGGGGGYGVAKRNVNSPAPVANSTSYSYGGGGGGAAISYISAPTIPGPVSVTVGAGGTGGVATIPVSPAANFTLAAGNPGGTSSFGPFLSATGGPGAGTPGIAIPQGCSPPAIFSWMQGGIGSGGMFNYKASGAGQITPTSYVGLQTYTTDGNLLTAYYSTSPTVPSAGLTGGGRTNALASPELGGIGSFSAPTFTVNTDGQNATAIGEGGSSAYVRAPNSTRPGGAGAAGIVIVEEFYS